MSDDATPGLAPDAGADLGGEGEIDVEVGAGDELSAEEAEELEYRQALAKARGEEPPKTVKRRPKKEEPEPEADEDAEEDGADEEDESDDDAENPEKDSRQEKDSKKDGADKEKAGPKVKKLKVNGKEVDFDFADEKAVEREVQKGLASTEAFQKAARIEKNAQSFVEQLKDPANAFKVLEDNRLLGPEKLREICEQYLIEKVKRESMSDEERERHDERQELERFRAAEEERKQQALQQRREHMKKMFEQHMLPKFQAALEQGDVPVSNWTVAQMGHYMKLARSKGLKNIQPQDVLPYVRRDWETHLRQTFSNMPGDKMLEIFGEEAVDKIRKANLARFERENSDPKPKVTGAAPKSRKKEKIYSSREEMMNDLLGDNPRVV